MKNQKPTPIQTISLIRGSYRFKAAFDRAKTRSNITLFQKLKKKKNTKLIKWYSLWKENKIFHSSMSTQSINSESPAFLNFWFPPY